MESLQSLMLGLYNNPVHRIVPAFAVVGGRSVTIHLAPSYLRL